MGRPIKFNHYAIAVKDLAKSLDFYHGVLGLPLLDRPDFDFEGAWLDLGHGISLHLIVQKDVKVASESRALHFAFEVAVLSKTKNHLLEHACYIVKDIKARPDGVLQLFVKDPDGYWIEFCQYEKYA